jgi:hypothetical protein
MSTRFSRGIERLPIRLVLLYVGATVFIFVFGPFDWPVENWTTLLGFLAATMFALWLGFRWASARTPGGTSFNKWRAVIMLGALASIVTLFLAAPVYTGRMPWEVLDALSDQGAAYRALQEQLELTAGTRGPIALLRILTWPLVFAVLPLGLLHWREMNLRLRLLVLTTLGCIGISSILRGTDREIADLMAVAGATGLVFFARQIAHEGMTWRRLLRRHSVVIVTSLLLVGIAVSLFAQRKQERYVGSAICLAGSSDDLPDQICADFDHPWFTLLDDDQRFMASMVAAYFSQGYYGLALGLSVDDFRPTWGLGNAPFAMTAYTNLTGDRSLYERTYTFRMRELGWSDDHRWSTMFPWIANDISFPMVPVFMLLMGALFGASWRDAVFGRNDCATIVLAIMFIMMGYLPANSQVTLVPDHLFALMTWVYVWRRTRHLTAEPATTMLAPRHAT